MLTLNPHLHSQKRRLNRGRVINATLPDDLWRHLLPHFTPQDLILISMLSRASNAIVMAAYDFWRKVCYALADASLLLAYTQPEA